MAELALGIAGVVPLIGGAIKAYKEVNTKLKLFCGSSGEVERLHRKLYIQRGFFRNECRLWLAFIVENDGIASEMASDPDHDGWDDPDLTTSIRLRLKDNFEAWYRINEDISGTIASLENRLASFVESSDLKKGKFKKAHKRARDGVKIALQSTNFDCLIKSLDESIKKSEWLRKQVQEIHTPETRSSIQVKASRRGEWANFITTRTASKALHEALIRAWTCCQPGHLGHSVKLFVETKKMEGEIRMDLAIACRNQTTDSIQSTLVQLEVRSQNLDWIEPHEQPPLQDNHGEGPSKRLKVLSLAETSVQTDSTGPSDTTAVTVERNSTYGSCDLRLSPNICKELMSRRRDTNCLGHIDIKSENPYRHSFYPAKETFGSGVPQPSSSGHRAIGMDEVLDDSSGDFFSTVDRLKLARSLVLSVLKFHSTPWLSDFWRLRDLAFFKTDQGEEVSEALRTLHLNVEVVQRQSNSMEGIQISSEGSNLFISSDDERLSCGINNLTLHSLGVALLQIDRWTRVNPVKILEVRKMASRNSMLGPRYREITRKCLWCDFGCGPDLTDPKLQIAIYENVIGALEKMISSLDLEED